METVTDFIFTADGDCSHEIKRCLLPGRKVMTNLDSMLKSRDITLPQCASSQGYGFSSGRVWMWELDHKESWAPKNWCFWTMMLEKTLKSPLNCKEFKPVNPKGNQSWIFIGRTDTEVEAPIFWPPDAKNWFNGKDPEAGKDWRQEEKGISEDEMVGCLTNSMAMNWASSGNWWWTGRRKWQPTPVFLPGDSQGWWNLMGCRLWGRTESDTTEGT